MISFRYITIITTAIILLTSCKSDNKKTQIVYKEPDLSFFNLKGKVKTFAEMRLNLSTGNGNFNQNDKEFKVPYHDYFFLKNGMLEKITNTNPPPYLPQRLIEFHRTENTLSFKLHSKKEIFLQKIVKSGDKLIWASYDKLDDNVFGYHTKKYINKTFVKNGDFYSQHSEDVEKK